MRAGAAQPDDHAAACALALTAVRGAAPADVKNTLGWHATWRMPVPMSAAPTVSAAAASAMPHLSMPDCGSLLYSLAELRVPVSTGSRAGIALGIENLLSGDDAGQIVRTVENVGHVRMLHSQAWPAMGTALERAAPRLSVSGLRNVLFTLRRGRRQLRGAAGAAVTATVAREAAAVASPNVAADLLQLAPRVLPELHAAAAGALAAAGSRHIDGMSPERVAQALGGVARMYVLLDAQPNSLRAFFDAELRARAQAG
jgi:hypothetical protein